MTRVLRDLPLAQKLTFAMMATSSVALLIACSFFLGHDIIRLRQNMREHLVSIAEIIGANSAAALTYDDPRSATLVLSALKSEPHILAANIYSGDGKVFVAYRRGATVNVLLPTRFLVGGSYSEPEHLTECRPIVLEQDSIGSVCLQADTQEVRTRGLRYLVFVLVFMITSTAAAFMVALSLKRFISQPILDLIRTTKIVSKEKNYAIRARQHAKDDLGLLVQGFNEMLSEIEKRDSDLKSEVKQRTRMNLELRKAKEAAEAASRAKSEFLANMSHEIRTPMNGVIGMTELALTTELSAEQRGYLQTVQSSSKSLMSVINNILDFSKIEADKVLIRAAEFILEELIVEIHKSFALRAHQKGLELMYEIADDVPGVLCSDAERLRQVLVNLIGNAIKFTDNGEVITKIEVESTTSKETVLHFSVQDTGVGIAVDKQTVIFDPFAQADTSHTRKYGGTGLGLTISRRIVEKLGGTIWVESRPGEGSKFHFRIATHVQPRPPAQKTGAGQIEGVRALIVDDNPASCRILQGMLRSWKMQPSVAGDSAAAQKLLRNSDNTTTPFQLLLADAAMPGEDGFTLVSGLQNLQHAPAVIMLLTSNDLHSSAARCRKLQISHYVEKPVRRKELLQQILSFGAKPAVPENATPALPLATRSLRILLAEDSPVNQQFASEVLLKMGHRVQVVSNGKQAVDTAQTGQFDVMLMDVQMPEMDGLEATAEIRRLEQETGKHVPIIALTAHVLNDDRQRCLAAGMDGYLQKPFYPSDLHNVLSPYCGLPAEGVATSGSGETPEGAENEVLNKAEALARAGGSRTLLCRVLQVFHQNVPAMWAEIQTSVANRDMAAIQRSAHTLKGSVGVIGAKEATAAARELEALAKSGKLEGVEIALDRLDRELKRLIPAVVNLRDASA
jgi:two-component system sensor histidine kinase/response regulator